SPPHTHLRNLTGIVSGLHLIWENDGEKYSFPAAAGFSLPNMGLSMRWTSIVTGTSVLKTASFT
ncbi:MAG: hypothetical protein LUD41_08055, partial [Phascolarctobacterium sp.]|nr:hypothetical protein [Phascolarctobacterium sp.]